MPVTPTYPGVYIEEISSGVRTITGVATSITAFVGYTARGRDNYATRIFGFSDFERAFGGLAADSELSYAVQQFFANGGSDAYVVRIPKNDAKLATISLLEESGTKTSLIVNALSKGAWANNVMVDIDYNGIPTSDTNAFNLTLTDLDNGKTETFANVTIDNTKSNYVIPVVNHEDNGSSMVRVKVPTANGGGRPAQTGTIGTDLTIDANGKLSDFKNDKDYTIKITSDLPTGKITGKDVPFISKDESLPTSVLGICRLLERKVTLAVQNLVPDMTIRCVPSPSGKGIRISALIGGTAKAVDAVLTFQVGAPNDADAMLKLSGGKANVSHYALGVGRTITKQASAAAGEDGKVLPKTEDLIGNSSDFTGINALDKVDLFNLLCMPDATRAQAGDPTKTDTNVSPNDVFGTALNYCKKRRAFLLIDAPPEIADVAAATDWKSAGLTVHDPDGYAAAYFPRLKLSDPLNSFQLRMFAPCGVLAGLYARTDATRGVWKAPAGTDATLNGVQGLTYKLTDPENGALNPLGLNCLRIFPVYGSIAWGARTLAGADAQPSDWK